MDNNLENFRAMATKAKDEIAGILDDLYLRTGVSISNIDIHQTDVTKIGSTQREIKHWVTLSASVVI